MNRPAINKEQVRKKFVAEGKSIQLVANELGVTRNVIAGLIHRNGWTRSKKQQAPVLRADYNLRKGKEQKDAVEHRSVLERKSNTLLARLKKEERPYKQEAERFITWRKQTNQRRTPS